MDAIIIDLARASGPWGAAFATLFGLIWWFFGDLHRQRGRDWWLSVLEGTDPAAAYRTLLGRLIDVVDRRLAAVAVARGLRHRPGAAWSQSLFELCLGLAIVYPALSVVAGGVFTGEGSAIGAASLFPTMDEIEGAQTAVAIFLAGIGIYLIAQIANALGLSWLYALPIWAGAIGISTYGIYDLSVAQPEVFTTLGIILFVLLGGLFFSFRIVVDELKSVLTFLLTWIALTTLFGLAGLLLFGVSGDVDANVIFTVAFGVSLIPLSLLFGRVWNAARASGAADAAVLLVLLALASVISAIVPSPRAAGYLYLFAVIPVLNAVADFASIGTSLVLIRWGLRSSLLRALILDGLVALVIRGTLGTSMVLCALGTARDGSLALALDAILAELSDIDHAGGDYLWFYTSLFTTALPSLVIVGLGVFVASATLARRLGLGIASGLASEIETLCRLSSLAFVLILTTALWLPAFLLWHVLLGTGPLMIALLVGLWSAISVAITP